MPMTVSILRAMRHIPEEELHAYLDQALSRSQCVEIESHLAQCPACRGQRDAIAALRDRTTALLATLTPGRAVTPPFELIEARRVAAAARRRDRLRRAAWAASLVAAVGAGWGLNQMASDRPAREIASATSPASGETPGDLTFSGPRNPDTAAAPGGAAAAEPRERAETGGTSTGCASSPDTGRTTPAPAYSTAAAPAPRGGRFTVPSRLPIEAGDEPALAGRLAAPRSIQVSSSGLSDGFALEGLWRTLSWENAQEEAGGAPAHVDGLPVMQVQVQQAASGKPLMVVAQQLGSGEVIRTIEGPAADVSSLLRATTKPGSSPWPTVDPAEGGTLASGDGSIVTMQGDRILAISAPGMSSDSLAAIARRVNASRAGPR